MSASALDALIKQGKVVAGSRVDLGAVEHRHGRARRRAQARYQLGRRAHPDASSCQVDRVSGECEWIYLSTEMFKPLGIADQVLPKSKNAQGERVGALIARGDAESASSKSASCFPSRASITWVRCRPRSSG